MKPTIVNVDGIVGGYRRFLVWPNYGIGLLDTVLIDGETYHCHPVLPIGETMGEVWEWLGRDLVLEHGFDAEGAYVQPVRWKDSYIDYDRWQGLAEHKDVDLITLHLKG